MLDVPVYLVQHFVAVLAVLSEKEAEIDIEAFEAFCNEFLNWFYPNPDVNWNFQNTSGRFTNFKISYLFGYWDG